MGDDLGLQKCTLTSLESRIEVQINEALERIHRFQAGGSVFLKPFFFSESSKSDELMSCEFCISMSSMCFEN